MFCVLTVMADRGIHRSGPYKTRAEAMAAARKEWDREAWRHGQRYYMVHGTKMQLNMLHEWELSGIDEDGSLLPAIEAPVKAVKKARRKRATAKV